MGRLEKRDLVTEVGTGRQPETADQPGSQVRKDVPIEVRHHDDVVLPRVLDQLHRHVIHDSVIELDVRMLLGDLLGDLQEEPIGELHDVGFVHGSHLAPSMAAGVIEGKVDDSRARRYRNWFNAEPRVGPDRPAGSSTDLFDHPFGFRFSLLELDAGVDVFGVLAHDDQIDVVVAGANAGIALAGPDERI